MGRLQTRLIRDERAVQLLAWSVVAVLLRGVHADGPGDAAEGAHLHDAAGEVEEVGALGPGAAEGAGVDVQRLDRVLRGLRHADGVKAGDAAQTRVFSSSSLSFLLLFSLRISM